MPDNAFRVDLRGIVDLLSHHLYSSPRVYLRELVQNATDAITARRANDPTAPARVLIVPSDVAPDSRLHCLDTGAGLRPADVERFLATIGASSKRDELGMARQEYLGQFGIGLLSCFLVSDEIELVTAADDTVTRWVGRSDGGYHVEVLDAGQVAAERRDRSELLAAAGILDWPGDGVGTWVRLTPRRGSCDWTTAGEAERLARHYAQMLALDVTVARPAAGPARVSRGQRPWDPAELGATVRREDLEALLGVPLLAAVPVEVREAGLRGLVAVLGQPTAPTSRQANHVYAKGMLVGTSVEALLPQWAFFARALVDTDGLRLTASREALYDDDLLEQVRSELGEQLRRWLLRTAHVDPSRFTELLALHELGIRALAVHDDDLYRVYMPSMSVESTVGTTTVADCLHSFDVLRWTSSVDEFRQLLPVASAQGLGVVNAGYVFMEQLMERLPLLDPGVRALQVHPGDIDAHIDLVADADLSRFEKFLRVARETLADLDVDVQLRSFRPSSLPALVLDDRERAHRRDSRDVAGQVDDEVWSGILAALDDGGRSAIQLMLNVDHPVVRRLPGVADEELQALATEALWCQALLLGQRPLRAVDQVVMNRSFVGLLSLALQTLDDGDATGESA